MTAWMAVARAGPAEGATITGEYAEGYRDVLVNGYGARGLGTFRLTDGAATSVGLCIESHVRHSNDTDAYAPVPNEVDSDELDVLLWWVGRHSPLDADTAAAAAALAWYYADAQRSSGGPVWANMAAGGSPIAPLEPHPWDGPLPPYSTNFPVGLQAGGVDLEAAEAKVAQLHRGVQGLRGAWRLGWDGAAFVVTADGRPLAGQSVLVDVQPGHGLPSAETIRTDADGRAVPRLPDIDGRLVVTARVDSPGVHREWDGADVQRLATPGVAWLTAEFVLAPTTTATTTSTSTTTTMPPPTTTSTSTTTTLPPTTSTAAPTTTSTSTSTTSTTPAPATTVAPNTTTTVAPTTAAPTTTAAPSTTAIGTSTTTTAAPAVLQPAPPPPTLPVTGSSDAVAAVLRFADYVFVAGVLLVTITGLTRRRRA
jgi:hypothetical protein